jgi:hypothetical protein
MTSGFREADSLWLAQAFGEFWLVVRSFGNTQFRKMWVWPPLMVIYRNSCLGTMVVRQSVFLSNVKDFQSRWRNEWFSLKYTEFLNAALRITEWGSSSVALQQLMSALGCASDWLLQNGRIVGCYAAAQQWMGSAFSWTLCSREVQTECFLPLSDWPVNRRGCIVLGCQIFGDSEKTHDYPDGSQLLSLSLNVLHVDLEDSWNTRTRSSSKLSVRK